MHLDGRKDTFVSTSWFGFDTTFILFFLSVEFGRIVAEFSFDVVLVALTLAMVAVLPYFLQMPENRPGMSKWLTGRMLVAFLGSSAGVGLDQAVGRLFPESIRFAPLALLIAAGIASSFLQFYGLMRLRLAK